MVSILIGGALHGSKAVFFPSRYMQKIRGEFVRGFKNKLVPVHELAKQKRFDFNLAKGSDATFGGFFAIQVALFLGYTEIYLVGYDEHNLEGHFEGDPSDVADREGTHLPWYNLVPKDRKIYVCNRDSAIKLWPFADPPML
jgi:hypothetical protein